MKTKTPGRTFVLAGAMSLTILAASLLAAPTIFPTGVTINIANKIYRGYVIYTPPSGDSTIMLDSNGNTVHTWTPAPGEAIGYSLPLLDGHILTTFSGGPSRRIVELDSLSHVVWDYTPPPDTVPHHDLDRLRNGHTLILCFKNFIDLDVSDKELRDDCLLEVDEDGTIVWEWQTADHIEEFGFSDDIRKGIFADGGDWAHANAVATIPWSTSHSDPRFAPGNIIVSYRRISTVAIIERVSGQIVWTASLTSGQHDSHMIRNGLPGAGNILVFDNGNGDGYSKFGSNHSRVIEIDPNDMSVPFEYDATSSGLPVWTFDSWFISGAQRLPNGNTLICEGAFGRIFEVDPTGMIVWEFINPWKSGTPPNNRVYRATKVPLGWAELS